MKERTIQVYCTCIHCGIKFSNPSVYKMRTVCDKCRSPLARYHMRKKQQFCKCGNMTKYKGSPCDSCKSAIYQRILSRKCPICEVGITASKSVYCSRRCTLKASYILSTMRQKLDEVIAN